MIDIRGVFLPQGRYFGNGVGIGFDAVVGFEALKLKLLTGFPSYIVAALRVYSISFTSSPDFSLTLMTTANNRQIPDGFSDEWYPPGWRFFIAPKGHPTDGKFSLCLVNELGKFATFPWC